MGLHWLDFTTKRSHVEVVAAVSSLLGEFSERGRGTSLYRWAWDGPHGATVEAGFRLRGSENVRVSLTGEACEGLGMTGAYALVDMLGGKVTRCDVAVDGAPFSPSAMWEAWQAGHVRTKVPRGHPDSCRRIENGEGTTVYVGSVSSERMLRCYDRRGPTRVELQLRRDMAQAWWAKVGTAESDERIGELAVALVAGFVEFAAPVGVDGNRSRWVRLSWWESFLAGVPALVGLVKRTPTAFVGLVGHVWRNAASVSTYLEAVAALGLDAQRALAELLSHGAERRPARHRAMLAGVRHAAPAYAHV